MKSQLGKRVGGTPGQTPSFNNMNYHVIRFIKFILVVTVSCICQQVINDFTWQDGLFNRLLMPDSVVMVEASM
jgi:hypothetical protein